MPVTEAYDEVPRPRRWPWALLAIGVLFIVVFGVIAYRNQQQWSRALKFQREVERAGGSAQIIVRYGTDFAQGPNTKARSRWQRMLTWPIVAGVSLPASAAPLQIDWSVAPLVKLGGLRVEHDQFTDDEFAKIPAATQLHVLILETPAITNRSLPRLQQIPTLKSLSTIGSAIEGPVLLQLAQATTCTLSVKVNTQELAALNQAGAISRLDDLELHSPGDFQADQLTGCRRGFAANSPADMSLEHSQPSRNLRTVLTSNFKMLNCPRRRSAIWPAFPS